MPAINFYRIDGWISFLTQNGDLVVYGHSSGCNEFFASAPGSKSGSG